MAFGFVVVKFSLFVKEVDTALNKPAPIHNGYSGPIGVAIIALGAFSLIISLVRYEKTKRQLLADVFRHTSGLLYLLTSVILLMSIILIMYLIKVT